MRLRWPMLEGNVLNIPGDCYKGGDNHQFNLSDAAFRGPRTAQAISRDLPKNFPLPARNRLLAKNKTTHAQGIEDPRDS